jgi:integrase
MQGEDNFSDINWNKIRKYYIGSTVKKSADKPYTHKEIAKILEKADQRCRIMILLMASSGLRKGSIQSLKLGDLTPIDEYNLYGISVYKGEPEEYYTFCTPECRKEIDAYLEYRKRYGKEPSPLSSKSPLIREQFDKKDIKAVQNPRFVTANAIKASIYNNAWRYSG